MVLIRVSVCVRLDVILLEALIITVRIIPRVFFLFYCTRTQMPCNMTAVRLHACLYGSTCTTFLCWMIFIFKLVCRWIHITVRLNDHWRLLDVMEFFRVILVACVRFRDLVCFGSTLLGLPASSFRWLHNSHLKVIVIFRLLIVVVSLIKVLWARAAFKHCSTSPVRPSRAHPLVSSILMRCWGKSSTNSK